MSTARAGNGGIAPLRFEALKTWAARDGKHRVECFRSRLAECLGELSPEIRRTLGVLDGSGGKCLRPHFVLMAGSLGDPEEEALHATAVALELVHTASLYHDDVIDDTPLRRGAPSLHSREGTGVAVLAGGFLAHRGLNLIQHAELSSPRREQRLRECIALVASELCMGLVEEAMRIHDLTVTESDYFRIIEHKTGSMFRGACEGGALCGGSPEAPVAGFGREFGILYQIIDDIRDLLCPRSELGKDPGSDLQQGIYTLPVIYALRADDRGTQLLRAILERRARGLGESEIERILLVLGGGCAFDEVWETANGVARRATEHLSSLPDVPARAAMEATVAEMLGHLESLIRTRHVRGHVA